MAALHTTTLKMQTQTHIIPAPHEHSHRHHTPHNKVRIKLTTAIFQQTTYNTHLITTKIHI
jgi:hypothetical protein